MAKQPLIELTKQEINNLKTEGCRFDYIANAILALKDSLNKCPLRESPHNYYNKAVSNIALAKKLTIGKPNNKELTNLNYKSTMDLAVESFMQFINTDYKEHIKNSILNKGEAEVFYKIHSWISIFKHIISDIDAKNKALEKAKTQISKRIEDNKVNKDDSIEKLLKEAKDKVSQARSDLDRSQKKLDKALNNFEAINIGCKVDKSDALQMILIHQNINELYSKLFAMFIDEYHQNKEDILDLINNFKQESVYVSKIKSLYSMLNNLNSSNLL